MWDKGWRGRGSPIFCYRELGGGGLSLRNLNLCAMFDLILSNVTCGDIIRNVNKQHQAWEREKTYRPICTLIKEVRVR